MNSRPLGACPRCGGVGRGGHLSGAMCAGFASSGERIGVGGSGPSSGGWVAYRVRRGSPCLERMYYDGASSSSLFRTNFLISHIGVAGAGEASRSHSPRDIASIVPTNAENPIASCRTWFRDPREMVYLEIRKGARTGLAIVSLCHEGDDGSWCWRQPSVLAYPRHLPGARDLRILALSRSRSRRLSCRKSTGAVWWSLSWPFSCRCSQSTS